MSLIRARAKAQQLLSQHQDLIQGIQKGEVQCELGIDQAGRGPVFGSMIYAALWWPISLKEQLGAIGFADSKALTQSDRDVLLQIIDMLRGKLLFYQTKQLTAEVISTSMNNLKHHTNLNELSHQAALQLSRNALQKGFKVTHIYADTVGDPGKYAQLLRKGLDKFAKTIENVVVQPKADRDHKVVSAASICAKVTRDRILRSWAFRQQLEFKGQLGSGYPGDPKTKQWLVHNKHPVFGYPSLVRFSWNTAINALSGQLKLRLDEEKMDQKTFIGFKVFEDAGDLCKDLANFAQ